MRIHIGSDHAGLELKSQLIEHLVGNGHDVTDHGPYEYDAVDDYPDFCIPAAEAVAKDSASLGIVLGGSGNGEQIAANKVHGIRAALAWSVETAKLAKDHNNANVVDVGGRMQLLPLV
jgi:ribose 5-phosphate isomerase B